MNAVTLKDEQRFGLVQELLHRVPERSKRTSPVANTIEVEDKELATLLARVNEAQWVILPYFGPANDHWLLTASGTVALEQAHTRLTRFLTPSYGCFDEKQSGVRAFDPTANKLQELAATLYPAGYYRWQSPTRERESVLECLMLWLTLETDEPRPQQEIIYSYAQLQQIFRQALDAKEWERAKWAVAELSRQHLTTAENLLFLRLQMLAARGEWDTIWQDDEFPLWSELTLPRSVRSILLTSCYLQLLQSYEEKGGWQEGLAAYEGARTRLGSLLSGPFQLGIAEVARMVIYQAVADGDLARIHLLEAADLDPQSEFILQTLLAERPPRLPTPPVATALEQSINALAQQDFALAEQVIPTITEPESRALLFVELAFHTQDEQINLRAWGAYQSLSFAQQEAMPAHPHYVAEYLTALKDRLLPATSPTEEAAPPDAKTSADSGSQEPLALRAWQLIGSLERRLRVLIATRYQAHFAQGWEQKLHTDSALLARWQDMQKRDKRTFQNYQMPETTLVDYTYLEDLSGMLRREWELFKDLFGEDRAVKQEIADKITAVCRVRNPLAHNRTVPENELLRAEKYCTEILQQVGES